MRVCGRWFDESVRERIMGEVVREPGISRSALAERVCGWLSWHNPLGQPQLASARKALSRLDQRGAIHLPALAAQTPRTPCQPTRASSAVLAQVHTDLASLGPVQIVPVLSAQERADYAALMQHHPLGAQRLCGSQLRYLFRASAGYLGACAFQGGTFALSARDRWIGWSENVRRGNLDRVVNNARFLILPTVRVPHLASHLLGRLARQLPQDWQQRYGLRPLLLETFVHPQHDGTCYKAAGWTHVGSSAGRRDGVAKAVWLQTLQGDARERLRHGPVKLPQEPTQPTNWAEVEFGALAVWDARLKRRACMLAQDFFGHAQSRSLSRRCADRAQTVASYRFFQNPKMTLPLLLQAHRQAVLQRMREHPVVLVPQDTTSLNYSAQRHLQDVGPIGTQLDGPVGLILHNSHAFTPQGVPLGVVSADCWARDPQEHRTQRPAEQRESRKWLDAYQSLQAMAAELPDTMLVSIGDREADLFELFALAREPSSPRLLVRASRGRQRQVAQSEGTAPLWAHVQAQAAVGQLQLDLPRRGSRAARKAQLSVRCTPVRLQPPKAMQDQSPIDLWAVQLLEEEAPEGATALEWMLLTNVPTTTLAQAAERTRWYTARWGIEVFHRTLKTGCQIEDRQLGYAARLESCLAIDLVVAWRIFHLTMLGRMDADAPCTVFFRDPEWRALYSWYHHTTVIPAKPPTLREATRWIAIKGGFQGRKADGHPGAEVLWHGLQKLDVAIEMYLLYRPGEAGVLHDEYPLEYRRPPELDSS